jgi:UDP-glucose 4-epimerase
MKCLLLGASGYLGRHLGAALQAEGHDVVACASPRAATGARLDLADRAAVDALDWKVDVVYLMAGATGTGASFADFERFVKANQLGLLNVLESIRQSGHRPRVVFPSTRLVYAGAAQALAETAALQPRTVYAVSKISGEQLLQAYAQAFGMPYTVFRVCVPYGNSQGGRYAYGTVGNFIQQAVDTGCIRLYGDGSLRRSFTHVDDVCRVIVQASVRADCADEIFNVPGEDFSLLEAAQLIAARLQAQVECVPWPAFERQIESGSTVFDGSKLLARLPGVMTHRMADWVQTIEAHHAG